MWLVDKPWANQIAWKCFKFMLPWVKATHRCRCWAPKCCDVAVAAGNNGEFADVAHEDAGNYCRAPCDGIRRTPRWLVIQLVQKIYTAVHFCFEFLQKIWNGGWLSTVRAVLEVQYCAPPAGSTVLQRNFLNVSFVLFAASQQLQRCTYYVCAENLKWWVQCALYLKYSAYCAPPAGSTVTNGTSSTELLMYVFGSLSHNYIFWQLRFALSLLLRT